MYTTFHRRRFRRGYGAMDLVDGCWARGLTPEATAAELIVHGFKVNEGECPSHSMKTIRWHHRCRSHALEFAL